MKRLTTFAAVALLAAAPALVIAVDAQAKKPRISARSSPGFHAGVKFGHHHYRPHFRANYHRGYLPRYYSNFRGYRGYAYPRYRHYVRPYGYYHQPRVQYFHNPNFTY